MGRSALDVANWLLEGAEKARLAGDTAASLALAFKANEYLQLAKLLGDSIAAAQAQKGDG